MSDEIDKQPQKTGSQPGFQFALFDADGVPWTSRIGWGWLFLLGGITGFLLGIVLGIYLGLWLKRKCQSASVLLIYSVLAVLCVAVFLPVSSAMKEVFGGCAIVLWFAGVFTLRHQVIRYYSNREGIRFHIDPVRTLIFSVWYINGYLRADYPLDGTGKASEGILKLGGYKQTR